MKETGKIMVYTLLSSWILVQKEVEKMTSFEQKECFCGLLKQVKEIYFILYFLWPIRFGIYLLPEIPASNENILESILYTQCPST